MLRITRNRDVPIDLLDAEEVTVDDIDPEFVFDLLNSHEGAFTSSVPGTSVRLWGRSGIAGDGGIGFDELMLDVERVEQGRVVAINLSVADFADGFLDLDTGETPTSGVALLEHTLDLVAQFANDTLADVHGLVHVAVAS